MALALYDRVKETTTTVGTGSVTLLGASTGFQSFAVVGNANTTYYCIADQGGANWEVGIGTYTASGTTLARTTVLSSSNADALVVFTAGVKDVFVTYPSSKGLWKDASGNAIGLGTPASGVVTNLTGTASININGTVGATTATTGSFTNLAYTGTLTGSTGVLNIGSGQVYKDASGNVGIGTSSPAQKLVIAGGVGEWRFKPDDITVGSNNESYGTTFSGGLPADTSSTAGGGKIFLGGNTRGDSLVSAVAFYRNNVESMRIDSSGNVGIGVIPAVKLDVESPNTNSIIRVGDYTANATNAWPLIEAFGSRYDGNPTFYGRFGASKRRADGTAIASGNSLGAYAFGGQWGTDTSYQSAKNLYAASIIGESESSFTSATTMSTAIVFNTGSTGGILSAFNTAYGTERMRIDSSGNVGIGATAPANKLSVNVSGVGSITALNLTNDNSGFAVGTGPAINFGLSSITTGLFGKIEVLNQTASIGSNSYMAFSTRGGDSLAEKVRIDSSGNVGIGTSSPGTKLELSTYSNTVIRMTNSAEANYRAEISSVYSNESFVLSGGSGYKLIAAEGYTTPNILKFYTANTESMRIDSAGNVGIGTSSPGAKLDVYGGYISTANTQLAIGNILSTTAALVSGNWYRIATFPASNQAQTADITVRHGNTHNNTIIKVAKGTGQWRAEVYRAGYYVNPAQNVSYPAINKVRIYDIGVNNVTHIDIQILGNTLSQTYNVIVKNNITDVPTNRLTLVALTDQGTTAAGVEFQSIGTMASWGNNNGQLVTFNESGNVGIAGAVTLNSLNNSAAIINGGTAGFGNIGASGQGFNTVFAKSTSAQYADLAENYLADSNYDPGTVLEFGGEFEVTECNTVGSTRAAGVVSTNPAHIMNTGLEGNNIVALALTGRVPTKVQGTVRKGDLMVSAGNGCARAEDNPRVGTIIGKALENFNGHYGVIEVVVGKH